VSLSLLKVGMLCCVEMDVASPCQTAVVVSQCLSLGFPFWVEPSGTGRFSEVVNELVCEQLLVSSTHRVSLGARHELFSQF
jgi:hypothetical protein